jgi:16S rRNA C967 or C1407 C5-methylase (RsmB/RsmF family)
VGGFLSGHRHFRVIPPPAALGCAVGELGTTILPSIHDTDGFFVSLLERTA